MKREERLRLSWIEAYRELQDAGAVCRRFGVSRPTLRKWLRRFEADGVSGLCAESRAPHRSPSSKVGPDEEALILGLRRTRRLGIKRLRHELHRLHGLQLSPATITKSWFGTLSTCCPVKRARHKPRRYSRPIPGDGTDGQLQDPARALPIHRRRRLQPLLGGWPGSTSDGGGGADLLDQVLEEMPFAIQRVQTDRGTEFFAEAYSVG